jgi:hypothetical protein
MSEASFAISVPEIPMAKPTSASLKIGASLVPSLYLIQSETKYTTS